MLRDGTTSIGEISLAVGFKDVAYFYRAFTRQYRMTPKQYRKTQA
jgi:AraC-like DNA-binding protein